MSKKKFIILARVNEYKMRDLNPHIPFTPEEIARDAVECEKAGAAIIHFHARQPDGAPSYEPEVYLDIARRIRERTDLIIDSTLGQNTIKGDEARSAHIVRMGEDPNARADMAAIDVGSTNLDVYDAANKRFETTEHTYVNTVKTTMFLAERMHANGVRPHLSCWGIPFLRQVDALLDMGVFREPGFVQLCFSGGGIVGGHRCTTDDALAYIRALPTSKKIEWTVNGKECNLLPAATLAMELGGHVSIGIGDYEYAELGYPTNGEIVAYFAKLARAYGRELATPAEARAMLGLPPLDRAITRVAS
ncbi:3-keto-5-aminohexanoate cleavage protein [Starkeya sp. ORNL1]|jgi:uncharacterized protein (DUF849 family)|uniref:3-keto-5-aminohexanoate cleavage protein n=1 Tax=Starkeya sp. ORNL1 TaxID=2709380 RepID=UPI00146434BA|nr:3-keto-5-aminohexanoate cleavage protein [Starkeya sp. ORNL1]QJP15033.1 3-keto-5-aminohexanoate cleavage protein [Starkeya sp. ORNL1]